MDHSPPSSSQRQRAAGADKIAAKRWQRVRHEWRMGDAVLFQHFLIAAAETIDADLLQHMQKHSDSLHLIITDERAHYLELPAELSLASLVIDKQASIEQIAGAIDPTRLSAPRDWPGDATPLPAGQLQRFINQTKRAGLLPALLVAALNAEQLLHWQALDLLRVAEKDLSVSPEPVILTALPAARVPLALAENARIMPFRDHESAEDHFALIIGEPGPLPLVRVHSSCITGDVLGSLRCDCGPQLQKAIEKMAENGGILLYLNQEGRGIGFANKMRAYRLQDAGLDTVDANRALGFQPDERSFAVAAKILKKLNISEIRLLTNNPNKPKQLTQYGIQVAERVPHWFGANCHNEGYLETKKNKSGHLAE